MTEAAVGRRERKKEETRRRIFVAALELFHEKGFEATTVDEITERADVAKGTFFNYFPRKESVLEYLSEEWLELAQEHAALHGRSAVERLLGIFGGVAEAYGKDRALARLVLRVSMERMCCPEPELARNGLHRFAMEAFREGQARGEFRADLNPEAAFGILASVFIGTLLWWASASSDEKTPSRHERSLHDVVEHQLKVVFDGIRAPVAGREG